MSRFLPTALVFLVLSAIGVSPAHALSPAGCINPADSALNEYCDVIPASTGGQTPQVGTPALAKNLPAGIARRAERRSQFRPLLTLPAREHQSSRRAAERPELAGEISGPSAFPGWLVAVLAAGALLLTGGTAARRRKTSRRAGPGTKTSG